MLGRYTLTRVPLQWVNLRSVPNGADIGNLYVGDLLTFTGASMGDWLEVVTDTNLRGWVSQQGGAVVFEAAETRSPIPSLDKIIDVSSNNGTIDWKAARADGVDIAILRASMGAAGVDTSLLFNFNGAFSQGAGIWFYHLFRPDSDGVPQAYHFLNTTRPLAHRTRMCVDVESVVAPRRILSKPQYADQLAAFVTAIKNETGELPTIYTSYGEWGKLVGRQHDALFAQCRLWCAHYTQAPKPLLPRGWTTYDLWQYTSNGRVVGIPSRVDLNRRKP